VFFQTISNYPRRVFFQAILHELRGTNVLLSSWIHYKETVRRRKMTQTLADHGNPVGDLLSTDTHYPEQTSPYDGVFLPCYRNPPPYPAIQSSGLDYSLFRQRSFEGNDAHEEYAHGDEGPLEYQFQGVYYFIPAPPNSPDGRNREIGIADSIAGYTLLAFSPLYSVLIVIEWPYLYDAEMPYVPWLALPVRPQMDLFVLRTPQPPIPIDWFVESTTPTLTDNYNQSLDERAYLAGYVPDISNGHNDCSPTNSNEHYNYDQSVAALPDARTDLNGFWEHGSVVPGHPDPVYNSLFEPKGVFYDTPDNRSYQSFDDGFEGTTPERNAGFQTKRVYHCCLCQKVFSSNTNRNRHQRSVHGKPRPCLYCRKPVKNRPDNKKLHEKTCNSQPRDVV